MGTGTKRSTCLVGASIRGGPPVSRWIWIRATCLAVSTSRAGVVHDPDMASSLDQEGDPRGLKDLGPLPGGRVPPSGSATLARTSAVTHQRVTQMFHEGKLPEPEQVDGIGPVWKPAISSGGPSVVVANAAMEEAAEPPRRLTDRPPGPLPIGLEHAGDRSHAPSVR